MKSLALALLLLPACMSPGANPDPCPKGFCLGGDANPPPADAVILPGADLSLQPCLESWTCTGWVANGNGMYSRTCTDANACGTTTGKPDEGPVALPALDLDYFKCKVEPIFDRGCSMLACHGTAAADNTRAFRVFSRGRRRNTQTVPPMCLENAPVDLDKMGTGTTMCHGWTAHTAEEWQKNFDNARSFMVGLVDPDQSDLLRQPVAGGKAHTGVHLWPSPQDPDYVTIRTWLTGAKLGMTCVPNN